MSQSITLIGRCPVTKTEKMEMAEQLKCGNSTYVCLNKKGLPNDQFFHGCSSRSKTERFPGGIFQL